MTTLPLGKLSPNKSGVTSGKNGSDQRRLGRLAPFTVTYDGNGNTSGTPPVDPNAYQPDDTVTVLGPGDLTRDGYLFAGWSTSPTGFPEYHPGDTFVITGDITLYAVWEQEPATLTVTYDANGGFGSPPVDPNLYSPGQAVTVLGPGDLTRAGYTFLGWSTDPFGGAQYQPGEVFFITGDTTLYAVWAAEPFTVTYDANGGSGTPPVDPTVHHYGDTVTVLGPGDLNKAGYRFLGWATNPSAVSPDYQPGDTFTITQDTTLYAVWEQEPATLTVTYNGNGETSGTPPVDPNVYHPGDTVTVLGPGDMTRAGYVFIGWSVGSGGSPQYHPGDTFTIFEDTALYAVWQQEPATLTVTYDPNGGSGAAPVDPDTYRPGDTVTVLGPGDLTRAGYRFVGWATTPSAASPEYQPGDTFTIFDNTTLYAVWEQEPATLTVTYDGNGETSGTPPVDPNTYHSGDTVTVLGPGDLTRAGYTFLGWSTDPAATTAQYQPGDTFTIFDNTTLYAVWQQEPATLTVTYDGNGETSGTPPVDPNTYHSGDTVTVLGPGDLTRAGYTFLGWSTDPAATTAQYQPGDTFTITGDTTLYAVWQQEPATLTVTYDGNGNTSGTPPVDPNTYRPGDTVTVLGPGDLTKTGYTFLGWSTDPAATTPEYQPGDTFTITENTTLYAVWEPSAFSHLTLDKRVVSSGPFEVGDTVAYAYTVTNTGNTALDDVTVTDDKVTTVICEATTLAAGQSTTCSGSHTITDADVTPCEPVHSPSTRGGGTTCAVTNTARAHGTDPQGDQVTSDPATATIEVNTGEPCDHEHGYGDNGYGHGTGHAYGTGEERTA
ncbi:InlB B-repeat-containing protein [Streptomyces sp. NPDC048717]|uniref:InlB B-repeat-containing protein n=1 Tax=Streptomyces sp. NPDC048717 TaxID=3154928 RepID=UPI003427322E